MPSHRGACGDCGPGDSRGSGPSARPRPSRSIPEIQPSFRPVPISTPRNDTARPRQKPERSPHKLRPMASPSTATAFHCRASAVWPRSRGLESQSLYAATIRCMLSGMTKSGAVDALPFASAAFRHRLASRGVASRRSYALLLFQLERDAMVARRPLAGSPASAVETARFGMRRRTCRSIAAASGHWPMPMARRFGRCWRKRRFSRRPERAGERGEALLSREIPDGHGELSEIFTSGSTGRPIRAVRTELWQLMWSAVTVREHLWHGRDLSAKLAAIRDSTARQSAPYPGGGGHEHWGFSTGDIFKTGPLRQPQHHARRSTTSSNGCAASADYLLTHPDDARSPVTTKRRDRLPAGSSQAGTHHLGDPGARLARELCRQHWGVPIVDTYSTREAGYLALQCPHAGALSPAVETVLVEVLDAAGKPCAPGEIGRVIATPLHNLAMPLLRYDLGDYAEVGEACTVRPRTAGHPPHPGSAPN